MEELARMLMEDLNAPVHLDTREKRVNVSKNFFHSIANLIDLVVTSLWDETFHFRLVIN